MTNSWNSPAQAFDDYRSLSRFSNLDGLRAICIAMVIWHHAQPLKTGIPAILNRGFLGVDFFFILSGYLITTLLLREAASRGTYSLKNFYIRRLLRIVPVYFFVVTIVAGYYIGVKGRTELIELLPYYYLFLSNFLVEDIPLLGITWSLSVEEQYYLIWPLLLLVLPKRFVLPVAATLVALNVLIAAGVIGGNAKAWGPLVFSLPNATYAPIIMGSMAAILLHRQSSFERLYRLTGLRHGALVGGVALVLFVQFAPSDLRGWPNFAIHLIMTYVLMSLVSNEENSVGPLLRTNAMVRVGVVSYGMYLYHLIALDIANRLVPIEGAVGKWAVLIICFVLTWVIAEASFRTIERYFQRFRPRETATLQPAGVKKQ